MQLYCRGGGTCHVTFVCRHILFQPPLHHYSLTSQQSHNCFTALSFSIYYTVLIRNINLKSEFANMKRGGQINRGSNNLNSSMLKS